MTRKRPKASHDLNDRYFRKHFARLVEEHGGKWIILAEGELIGIGGRKDVSKLIQRAKQKYPHSVPFASPIPAPHELECLL